ncbi:uncharacterized protein LOC134237968, partial [Saccostrea cucullata]|uniref:uncharacterized protein LOC134237968 n=1 Tax=Saccostrea cuccullata TaxID=36930 RepID=UPI002ED346DD
MRNRPTRKASAKEGAVVHDETGPRKSIKARKRKYEDRQINEVNTPTKDNKQRKLQNDHSTNRKASTSIRGPRNQSMAKGNPRRKRNKMHDEKIKRSLNKSEEITTHKSVLQTKEPKRVTRSSSKSAGNSKKGVNKDSDSKLRQQIKGTRERKRRLPKQTNKTRENKQPKTSKLQGKGFVVKKSNPKKEKEHRQSTQAERMKKLKANKNRDIVKKKESSLINKTKDIETSTTHTSDEYFSDLFLKKISV